MTKSEKIVEWISAAILIVMIAFVFMWMWHNGQVADNQALHDNTAQKAIAAGYPGNPYSEQAYDLFHNAK